MAEKYFFVQTPSRLRRTPPYKGGDTLRSRTTEHRTQEILTLIRGGGTSDSDVTVGSNNDVTIKTYTLFL